MKFRFCGDLDCPDWVLAEITTLTKITSVKMKILCQQVITDILGDSIDYDKVFRITTDAKYELNDVKGSISTLFFIFCSAAKHAVDEDSLSSELQQLGLPKEHATALCKAYSSQAQELQKALTAKTLRLPYLQAVHWRVDYVLSSSHLQEVNEPMVHLCLKIKDPHKPEADNKSFTLTVDKFRVFLTELKQAKSVMENLAQQ